MDNNEDNSQFLDFEPKLEISRDKFSEDLNSNSLSSEDDDTENYLSESQILFLKKHEKNNFDKYCSSKCILKQDKALYSSSLGQYSTKEINTLNAFSQKNIKTLVKNNHQLINDDCIIDDESDFQIDENMLQNSEVEKNSTLQLKNLQEDEQLNYKFWQGGYQSDKESFFDLNLDTKNPKSTGPALINFNRKLSQRDRCGTWEADENYQAEFPSEKIIQMKQINPKMISLKRVNCTSELHELENSPCDINLGHIQFLNQNRFSLPESNTIKTIDALNKKCFYN